MQLASFSFPVYANPTLTLVALALRLADYVEQNYA
jgi:hypothetical protein